MIDYALNDQLAFFDAVSEGFDRAEAKLGSTIDRYFCIADHVVLLRFGGPALMRHIIPALAHLEIEPSENQKVDLTIKLFDSVSTQSPMPLMVRSLVELLRFRWWEHLDNRREMTGYNGKRIRSVFHLGPDIMSVLDLETNSAVYWIEDADNVPYYEMGYPLTTLLNWWLGARSCYFLHAASIGTPQGGILLAGKGGSGKSTTTLACVESDLQICGDDYCVVGSDFPPKAYSLYNSSKLKGEEDIERFSQHKDKIVNLDKLETEKATMFLHEHFPGKMMPSMPIKALFVPEVTGKPKTRIVKAPASAGFKALAPATIFQLAGNGREAFSAMVRLSRQVPCYKIELGTEINKIPSVIKEFLEAN
ncbi:MAG: serine kinase [Chloroflexota bacterium]